METFKLCFSLTLNSDSIVTQVILKRSENKDCQYCGSGGGCKNISQRFKLSFIYKDSDQEIEEHRHSCGWTQVRPRKVQELHMQRTVRMNHLQNPAEHLAEDVYLYICVGGNEKKAFLHSHHKLNRWLYKSSFRWEGLTRCCGRITPHSPDLDVIEILWDDLNQAVDAVDAFTLNNETLWSSGSLHQDVFSNWTL